VICAVWRPVIVVAVDLVLASAAAVAVVAGVGGGCSGEPAIKG
jgi:hypothetical protein